MARLQCVTVPARESAGKRRALGPFDGLGKPARARPGREWSCGRSRADAVSSGEWSDGIAMYRRAQECLTIPVGASSSS